MPRTILGAVLLLLLLSTALAGPRVLVPDRDDIQITEDVILAPGVHRVIDANGDGVLHVTRDGITVNFAGATLVGSAADLEADAFRGRGVSVVGARDVTIRGGAVRGYKVAVRAQDAPGIRVIGVDVSGNWRQRLRSTPEREESGDWLWPHENDDLQWETRYGGGISLVDSPAAEVTGCRARRGQNGLLLTRCDGARVAANDFSFLSGWGLAMWRSSRCVVTRNRLDWCVRGYSHGVYDRGQDSTGILIFEQCHDNVFAYNSATHGGDGFFLYAGHETTRKTGRGGCNGNLVYRNDFSHAVANGIEATFSERNLFLENRLDDCNYGVWAGYSRKTVVRGNVMRGCSIAGVAIEHGQDNVIEGNVIEGGRSGVSLWWDEDPDLTGGIYGKEQDTSSSRSVIRANDFRDCGAWIRLASTSDVRIVGNEFRRCRREPEQIGDCPGVVVEGNTRVEGDRPPELRVARWRALPAEWPFLPEGTPRGRERIVVDEWGPYDFAEPRLWPAEAEGGEAALLALLGADEPFEVVESTGGLEVTPRTGRAPARLRVTASGDGPSLREGRVAVRVGEALLTSRVRLLAAHWTVRYFDWTADPREDPGAFATLVAGEPAHEETLPALDLRWGSGAPAKSVPADGFATVAEATLRLPAGTYEIATVSDDGVRVLVDETEVIENWTWHGPTEDRAKVKLESGEHRIRVEHFELDGFAVLSLRIRRIGD